MGTQEEKGENIVRGNKESIKNLLDIFEGLLEYLTEEISETSSQSGDDPDPREKDPVVPIALWEDLEDQHKEALPAAKPSSSRGSSQSSLPSWDAEGSESTTELIRLGDSAHTFITKQDKPTAPLPNTSFSSDPLNASATQLGHPIRQAIPLQPPYQPPQHRPDSWSTQPPGPGDEEPAPLLQTIPGPSRAVSDSTAVNGTQSRLSPGTPHPRKPPRTRSLSPSPPRARRALQGQFKDTVPQDQMQHIRREVQREWDLQRRKAGIVGRAYEDVLKSYKGKERIQISKEKAKAKETEQEYKENLYKDAPRTPKRSRIPPAKPIPHTPRASQGTPARGVVRPSKAPPMKIKDNDLLPLLLEEFPCLHVSPHALNKMWKQQFRQIEQLTGSVSEQEQERSRAKLNTEVEEAQRKYELLVEIIRKEQEHNQRLKDFKDRIRQQKSAQSRMREQRQQVARAKKYYNDYHVQLRARMLRSRTREERIFKNLFEEGLEIQKKRVRELHSYAKDQREEHKKKHKEELESMENYYKDQFSMLAETLAQEQQEIQVRKKAQEKALQKMKKELRGKMEREIGELQEMIVQNDDDVYFRELEAERLSRRVHMASFQYSTSHLL
ncbi:UNVERIFIED_CONTAM: hypothetical protein FKN15_062360 [Acipenser sinensis]